jgi:nucleotide-binding universal stress UspA family protein
MPLKDLLVCVSRGSTGDGRLKLAFNLARANGAHVVAAYPLPAPPPAMAPTSFGVVLPAGMTAASPGEAVSEIFSETEAAGAFEQRFKSELRLHGISGAWHLFSKGEGETLIELANSVDLTITGQLPPKSGANGAALFRPDELVMAAGRPVLIIPYAGVFETVGKRALIAWDGSREASRALHDALPLLVDAQAATLIFVASEEKGLDQHQSALERVAGHLRRHGVPANAEATLRQDLAVSDVLLSRAADLAADLIVAGGYHHSQFREALFGGVSRELLDHMTVPVLMSH